MNKNIIIAIVVILVALVGIYIWSVQTAPVANPDTTNIEATSSNNIDIPSETPTTTDIKG
jgi:flagellar basal body-associated protein FliL